ncbi:tRNA (adenosine(37)-N6)-threonylcarbamoyltransferase complex dimerization subunit type 1 TsaB [Thermodesulfobacteriota bacterium]
MILAFNTSTPQYSLAVLGSQGAVHAEYQLSSGTKNFSNFLPSIDSLLSLSQSNLHDLKALILAIGPGSYTGLRVGLSAAKGMAHALRIPIIGVSSLEALAHQLPCSAHRICTIIDSRKGEFFCALFVWSDDRKLVRLRDDTALKIERLDEFIDERTLIIGNDFRRQGDLLRSIHGPKALLAPAHLWGLRASSVGALGLLRFHKGDFDHPRDLVPAYLRPPDIRPTPISPG